MSSVLDLIKGSMKELGLLAAGETPSSEESKDILETLNDMIDDWSNQNLLVFGVQIESFTLTPGQSEYTLGSGGDLDTTVPIGIDSAYLKDGDDEHPVSIVDNKIWGSIGNKATQSDLPDVIYIDNNFPLKRVYLYPVPLEANTLILHTLRQISRFSTLTETINLPKGYKRALVSNLALDIAPQFGATVSGELLRKASSSMSNIKRSNIRPVVATVDNAILSTSRTFDWRTGE